MVKANNTSVQEANDKRQFTALVAVPAEGPLLDAQLIFAGKTAECLPQFPGELKWEQTYCGTSDKQMKAAQPQESRCFVGAAGKFVSGIASCCVTSNHWSDNITSIAWSVPAHEEERLCLPTGSVGSILGKATSTTDHRNTVNQTNKQTNKQASLISMTCLCPTSRKLSMSFTQPIQRTVLHLGNKRAC